MKINLRSRKPRIDKNVQAIEMEHPGAVVIEFGELHVAKIKKALRCKTFFCGEDGIRTHDLLTASQAL